jgi:hypothetical protein
MQSETMKDIPPLGYWCCLFPEFLVQNCSLQKDANIFLLLLFLSLLRYTCHFFIDRLPKSHPRDLQVPLLNMVQCRTRPQSPISRLDQPSKGCNSRYFCLFAPQARQPSDLLHTKIAHFIRLCSDATLISASYAPDPFNEQAIDGENNS